MSAIISVASPKATVDENGTLEHLSNHFQISDVIDANNTMQCYINQDNTISFINNGNTFTNENGDMFYACLTSAGDITQQEQILQLIPQNFLISDNLVNGNQFFNGEISELPIQLIPTNKKQRCFVCSVDFQSKRAYLKHMSIHDNDREFKCSWCKMSYNHEINLLVHVAIIHPKQCSVDDTDLSYRCLVCALKFSREKALQGHCLIHQVDEELLCDRCSLPFNSRVLLNRHLVDHRDDNDQFVHVNVLRCKLCHQTYDNIGHIKRHYKQAHRKEEEIWPEDLCTEQPELQDKESDQNLDPSSKRRRSSKIASHTIKLYAEGKLKHESSMSIGEKKRGRPRKIDASVKKHSSKNDVICPICQRTFKTPILLRRHEVTHTGLKEFECPICQKKFTQKSSVKIHMVIHDNIKAFKCQLCHKMFTYEHNMLTHIRAVHKFDNEEKNGVKSELDNDNYGHSAIDNCNLHTLSAQEDGEVSQYLCHEVVISSYIPSTPNFSVDKTQTITENRGILVSEEIDKLDKETGQMQVQEVIRDRITGFKRYRCRFCKKLYRKSGDLSRHVRIHTLQRPFKCYLCRKSFRLKSVLKNHFKSHWKLKEFSCELCLKSFNLKQTLKAHLRLHNINEMKYSCNICQKRFNSSFHYKYHNRTQHKPAPEVEFDDQNPVSTSLSPLLLDSEMETVRGRRPPVTAEDRPFKCNQCDKSYKLKKYLRDHMNDHINYNSPKACTYCDRSFQTLRSLQQHSRTHHINRRAFACSQCPASFILKSSLNHHGLVHSTSKPYACPLCFRRFKAKIYCDRHISLQKCVKKRGKGRLDRTPVNEIVKLGSNIESEILTTEQQSTEPYCNFRLVDLDLNPSQASNILVTNYVNEYSDKFMVVSLDSTAKDSIQQTEHASSYFVDDRDVGGNCQENMLGMLENQMGVNSVEIGAMYNYENNNITSGYQQHTQQSDNIYYYQPVPETEISAPKSSLADKFPILKATLFSDDNRTKPATILYDQEPLNPSIVVDNDNPLLPSLSRKLYHGCANCPDEFLDSSTLIQHVKLSHRIPKDFVCHVCSKAFSVQLSLWAHSKIHDSAHNDANNDDFLMCVACNQKFISVPSLSRHVRMQHNDKLNLYRCTHCEATYKTTRELDAHIKQLNADYDAIIINSQLINNPNNGNNYQRLSRDIKDPNYCKDFLIELENAEIDQIASLDITKTTKLSMQELIKAAKQTRGVRKLKAEKSELDPLLTCPYSCSTCHKGFNRASNLQQHLSVHTKMTPFQCTKCNRKFRHRCSLKTHETTKHSVVMKLLRCHLCMKLLRSQVALRNHMKIHLKNYSFQCETCLRNFSTYQERVRHDRLKQCCRPPSIDNTDKLSDLEKHNENENCEERKEETSGKTVKCVTCSVAFASTIEYGNHRCSKQKRKSHQCVLCDETFISSAELCVHICDFHKQQTKYNCELCNILFVQESLLFNHQKTVHNL